MCVYVCVFVCVSLCVCVCVCVCVLEVDGKWWPARLHCSTYIQMHVRAHTHTHTHTHIHTNTHIHKHTHTLPRVNLKHPIAYPILKASRPHLFE